MTLENAPGGAAVAQGTTGVAASEADVIFTNKVEEAEERPSERLLRLVTGFYVSQAIHVAATLGIAELLAGGPQTSDALAAATGTHPRALYRLLRTLASVGVFDEQKLGRFALTPLGGCLRSDAPEPVAPLAVFFGQSEVWRAWGELLTSIRTGECAFNQVHGVSAWEYRTRNPEAGAAFDAAMTGRSRLESDAILAGYDFGQFKRVVDVGGGRGAFIAALLGKHSHARGVLFDQPQVVAGAGPALQAAGVFERCDVVGGNVFEEIPAGGDAYVLKHILMDWEDEEALSILEACRRAIVEAGKLIIIEPVIAPPNQGVEAKLLDLGMLVTPGGRARTRDELSALFHRAGFRLSGVWPVRGDLAIIEGAAVQKTFREPEVMR